MKRKLLPAILISLLAVMACTLTVSTAKADILPEPKWLGQYHDYDPFWDSSVTVFPQSTVVTLLVEVYNNALVDLNVSAVKVYMDWDQNYSSTECSTANPAVLRALSYRTFLITFTMPSTSVASNLFKHRFTIHVDEVDSTNATGPQEVTSHDTTSGSGFVVYSTVQKQAQVLYDEINILRNMYLFYTFSSVEAGTLWDDGIMHYGMGVDSHDYGDFDGAKSFYEAALLELNNAISAESAYLLDLQDYDQISSRQNDTLMVLLMQTYISSFQAQADAYKIQANATLKEAEASIIRANATMIEADAHHTLALASLTQAYAWIVFGIGFIVFGIAAIVWASKRSGPTPQ